VVFIFITGLEMLIIFNKIKGIPKTYKRIVYSVKILMVQNYFVSFYSCYCCCCCCCRG